MSDEEHQSFSDALASWGLTAEQIADTLDATDFGLGLVELKAPDGGPSPGIAIVVDDRRDRELRELFDWRGRVGEEQYAAAWEIDDAPAVRVVFGPDEQALIRLAIALRKPVALERRYLFAVGAVAPLLATMQVPGTGIWLAAATAIEKEAARAGPGEAYDVVGLCLRAGVVSRAVPSIDDALAHVGAPRNTTSSPPMNRAERRAAQRRKP